MSKMKLARKPPLTKSPIRARPSRVLRSSSSIVQTPQGSLKRTWSIEETESRRKYLSISSEFEALAKMVQNGFGEEDDMLDGEAAMQKSPLFERGRFYDAYSARRNERLKRKKGEDEVFDKKKTSSSAYGLGVNVESTKRRESKKLESGRKSISSVYAVADRSEHPRYSLRSAKDDKKPPLYAEVPSSAVRGGQSVAARRVRRM